MAEIQRSIYDFSAPLLANPEASPLPFAGFAGQVLLIVNTASKCGNTPQYAALERLYRTYKDQGFTVLGFPCNQFGHQDPGSHTEIASFCQRNYGVSFPLFTKIEVNGPHAHPLFQFLKQARPGIFGSQSIKWNFCKFLVDRQGHVVRRYAPATLPKKITSEIERLLSEK